MNHAEAISAIESSIAALHFEGRSLELAELATACAAGCSLVAAARMVRNAVVLEAKGDVEAAAHQMTLAFGLFDYAEKRTKVIDPEL